MSHTFTAPRGRSGWDNRTFGDFGEERKNLLCMAWHQAVAHLLNNVVGFVELCNS